MNAPDNIYIVQWPSRQSPGGKWHTEIPVIPHPELIYQYIRHDIHAAVVAENEELRKQIKIVQNAARNLEISGREIAKHDLARAEKLFSESKPEVIDSEREANALLTEENLRLEQENDELRREVERLKDLLDWEIKNRAECEQ